MIMGSANVPLNLFLSNANIVFISCLKPYFYYNKRKMINYETPIARHRYFYLTKLVIPDPVPYASSQNVVKRHKTLRHNTSRPQRHMLDFLTTVCDVL